MSPNIETERILCAAIASVMFADELRNGRLMLDAQELLHAFNTMKANRSNERNTSALVVGPNKELAE